MSRKPVGAWRSPQDREMWRRFDSAQGTMAALHDDDKHPVGVKAPLDGTFLSHKEEFVRWSRPLRRDGTRLPGKQVRPVVIREVRGARGIQKKGKRKGKECSFAGRFVSRADHEERVARYQEMAKRADEVLKEYGRRKRSRE